MNRELHKCDGRRYHRFMAGTTTNPYCDLHIHSTASDGTDAPADLPVLAQRAGLAAMALTDHDTVAGLAKCAVAAKKIDIAFVPGIELSADPASLPRRGTLMDAKPTALGTLHILGLFIRYHGPAAQPLHLILDRLIEARAQRNPRIIDKLNDLGVRITYEQVLEAADGAVVGRPHIAQVMQRHGYVKSIHEAFARYLGQDGAAYVRKDRLSAAEALEAIHHAGGLACLAHPVQLRLGDAGASGAGELEHVVARLTDMGLDGIETRHSDHTPAQVQRFEQWAVKYHLLPTGGSDYHGGRKAVELGSQNVPYAIYAALHDRWREMSQAASPV